MPKRRRSKAFWKNFKFKYKLTIVNENTLEEIVGLRVSKLNGLSVLLCVLAVLFLIASCIITFTPLRNYLPGYMNSEVRTQIVDNALRVDSLQQVLNKQNLYIMNIQDIFSGKVSIDSVQTLDSLTTAREDTLMERTKRDPTHISKEWLSCGHREQSHKYHEWSNAIRQCWANPPYLLHGEQ